MVKELTNGEFEEFIKSGTAVIDFFAEWCMPCLMMAPVFDEMAEKFSEINFGKINIDDDPELAEKYSIMSIPCIVIFKDGKEAQRFIGVQSENILVEKLNTALNES